MFDKFMDYWFHFMLAFCLLIPLLIGLVEAINNSKFEPTSISQETCQKDKLISVGTVKVNGFNHSVCLSPTHVDVAVLIKE